MPTEASTGSIDSFTVWSHAKLPSAWAHLCDADIRKR
jgi:hypothetical protein